MARLLVDFDSTIASSGRTIVELFQKKTRDYTKQYRDEDLEWDFEPYITKKEDLKWALNMFSQQEFYDNLEPIEGAIECLERLSKNHEIVIVTKKNPSAVDMNAQWIRNNLPFIKRVVYLDQEDFDKSLIDGDILIDDKVECHLGKIRNYNLLFGNYAYQKPITFYKGRAVRENVLRIKDWYSVENLINSLYRTN